MKKINVIVAVLSTFGLILAGCNKNDAEEAGNNITENPSLNGTFEGPCLESEIAELSMKQELIFAGNQFTATKKYYESSDCIKEYEGGKVDVKGDFVLGDKTDQDSKKIEIQYAEAFVTSHEEYFTDALNTIEFCGRSDYVTGKSQSITSGTSNLLCPVRELPQTVFGVYSLRDDKLLLNEGGLSSMTLEKESRPEKLDGDVVYRRK